MRDAYCRIAGANLARTPRVAPTGRRKNKEKRVRLDDRMDDNDDVVVWRPIQYAMASHRRVLVVDDYREAAEALQMLLNADGFECRALEDPLAVCDLACEWQPFAVVLDIRMPGLDGLELARRLRAHPDTSHMLLVACTASASRDDRARAKAVGFDAHCAKPLTPERLLRVLESAAALPAVGPS
ncbi:response regulator receiver domain-containing protein [Paraburkholderia bryophila]|uniref:Response regulator receiver domain-containing protein n=1 Tax=Paraburkholderia bryophila TaxID=420952 RepID=A0A329BKF5_9BURK|nr:response regulator receiver domain-containing protein [Paraburkholderia bryophila]